MTSLMSTIRRAKSESPVLMALASEKFDAADYIRNYEEFRQS